MLIEIISDHTIKVTLDSQDLQDFGIQYRKLSRSDPNTKEFLLELLGIIELEKGIDLCCEKLFVEAFPGEENGCLLYISTVNRQLRKDISVTPELICQLFRPEQLPDLSQKIFRNYSHLLHDSELYEYNECFRLILTVFTKAETGLCRLLREYGALSFDSVSAAFTREHFHALATGSAVEQLSAIPPEAF